MDEEIILKFLNQEMPMVKNQVHIRPMKTKLPKVSKVKEQKSQVKVNKWDFFNDWDYWSNLIIHHSDGLELTRLDRFILLLLLLATTTQIRVAVVGHHTEQEASYKDRHADNI